MSTYSEHEQRLLDQKSGEELADAAFAAAPDLLAALDEARLQIEYLGEKFGETGTGNAVLARIRAALAKARTA